MRISIALCTYNGAEYLEQQLDSFTQQTRLPDELVISDDRSTDDTVAVIEAFRHSVPFPVHLHQATKNLGSTRNFDKAISLCKGDWIALADQDDYWFPHKLQVFENTIAQYPKAGLLFSDAQLANSKLQPQQITMWNSLKITPKMCRDFLSDAPSTLDYLLKRNMVMGAACAIHRQYIDSIRPISPLWVHDYWIALLISLQAQIVPVEEPLMYYRQHGSNQIGANTIAPLIERAHNARKISQEAYQQRYDMFLAIMEHIKIVGFQLTPQQESKIQRKLTLVRFRANLPQDRVERWHKITKLLLSGVYQQYAPNGVLSAIRDVIAP